MTAATHDLARPELGAATLAQLRSELEQELSRLRMTAGVSDGGTTLYQGRAQIQFRKLVAALVRMKEGTYGNCLACGESIPYERLTAIPEASTCLPCTVVGA